VRSLRSVDDLALLRKEEVTVSKLTPEQQERRAQWDASASSTTARKKLRKEMVSQYNSGSTIREVAAMWGIGYTAARHHLALGGAYFRSQGPRR